MGVQRLKQTLSGQTGQKTETGRLFAMETTYINSNVAMETTYIHWDVAMETTYIHWDVAMETTYIHLDVAMETTYINWDVAMETTSTHWNVARSYDWSEALTLTVADMKADFCPFIDLFSLALDQGQ